MDLWSALRDEELTVEHVRHDLRAIQGSDLWVVAACVDRLVDITSVQRALLELGLERTEHALERAREAYMLSASTPEIEGSPRDVQTIPTSKLEIDRRTGPLIAHFRIVQDDAHLCRLRDVLLERLDRLNTFVEICNKLPELEEPEQDEGWEDDPWTDGGELSNSPQQSKSNSPRTQKKIQLPISLPTFLSGDLLRTSCLLASRQLFVALRILLEHHGGQLWPHRFTILDSIPEHSQPTLFRDILPGFDLSTNCELLPPFKPWRTEPDFSQTSHVQAALDASSPILNPAPPTKPGGAPVPLSASELTRWYADRVNLVISSTGMIDVALLTVQHGASQGVPDIDGLGEELSLLLRLVYDSPGADVYLGEDWTLDRWKSLDPPAIIRAYLAHSTPGHVAKCIMRLVMPYLYVLESRAERAGQPDPGIVNRLLYDYILETPLAIIAAVFEASKPTLPATQRIIRDDQDMARLALACLYGSGSLDEWTTMSAIFECLPVWDTARDDRDGEDVAEMTISSLDAFVNLSIVHSHWTPSDLLEFFKPLSLSSISLALDILDVHLESAEILSRWSVPAPLRWFLQSSNNAAEQRAWATRMARRTGCNEDQLNIQDNWEWLLKDMLKLAETGETGLGGGFGLLSRDEIARIFLSGLLSTGKFAIAKTFLNSPKHKYVLTLDPDTIEEICLACSREFYDNASSGNYKFGQMKLAYECLEVPSFSALLLKEKDFIEATSRLSSFNILSRSGIPISPIEIRLTKDRLSLVSRVLSSNADAYKHTQVILDLVHKLGFRDDIVAEVKTFAMLAETALQAEDFTRAHEISERMVGVVLKLRSTSIQGKEDLRIQAASEVCWVTCFQLGQQAEFDDVPKKLTLLGHALELCPPDKLHDVLTAWRKVEKEDIKNRKNKLAGRHSSPPHKESIAKDAPSLASQLRAMRVSPSALAQAPDIASRTFNRVAANFSFSVGSRSREHVPDDVEGSRGGPASEDVSVHATTAFQKGIGWLIGADDV